MAMTEKQRQEEQEFDKAFDVPDGVAENMHSLYEDHVSPLSNYIEREFVRYESDRRLTEERWAKDLRQYRGEYDPELLGRLHPKRSKAFLSLTRTKTKTVSARMTDLLFPANGDKNWGIDPTPIPDLNPEIIQSISVQYMEQTGEEPTEEMIKQFIDTVARERSDAMEKEMEDQLSEIKYRSIIRSVIRSGNLYGTGILKGPLGKTETVTRWLPNRQTGEWVPVKIEKTLPYAEFVPVWDFYPDMAAREPDAMRGCFQAHLKNRNEVFQLAKRSDFNGKAIMDYLKIYKKGDADYKPHEQDLKDMNEASETETTINRHESSGPTYIQREGKYRLLEFWGYLPADELAEQGVDIGEEQMGMEVAANIWMLGPMIIKAVVSPVEGVNLPYQLYYYDKDDTSIWGDGIPSIMRDPQKLFNAGVRAMLDNAAISAGPIIEANMDLLDANEDPKDLYPFRVFQRDGMGQEAAAPAIRVTTLPSYTNEFMAMIQFFMNSADEVTAIPRYMYGDQQMVGGAGKTATGLSMLMGAANVTLKDQVKNFDDGITIPFIKSLYMWNMDFSSKEHIKGDFNIVAKGSTSLIAREVKAEAIQQFMVITANDFDMQFVNRDQALREWAKVMDIDEIGLIKDPNTVKIENEQRAAAADEEKKFMRQLAMIKATSGGHMEPNLQNAAAGEGLTPGLNPEMKQLTAEQLESGQIPDVQQS